MEDDFYATVKLNSGEEIFAKVMPCFEQNKTFLLITNPITFSQITTRTGSTGYKIESWLKTTKEDMFILDMDDIITMSESKDVEMIMMYQSWIRDSSDFNPKDNPHGIRRKINRKMGYITNVNDAKEILEKLYRNS
jgi:hypothetical protein